MIITRSPLRISLGGGGTDLPSYYREHEGFLIAGAIDKHIYITIHRTFVDELIVKYSKLERVLSAEEIEHPIFREAMLLTKTPGKRLEISSMADIPAGTGLGSSGSFTTSLLRALHHYNKNIVTSAELAEQACHIEIDILGEPIGKQDQYISAFGGLTAFHFRKDGRVDVTPVKCDQETLHNLEDNLTLFFTGYSRSASSILKNQDDRSKEDDGEMLENLHYVKEMGRKNLTLLEQGRLDEFGTLMHEHWEHKKKRSGNMSNPQVDAWYEIGRKNGALGGKLVGAGGGGFLMFYTEDKTRLRHAMIEAGLEEVRFRFDFEGSKVIASS